MLACVAFEYVDASLYVKGCVEEEGDVPLRSSSTSVETVCVMKLTCAIVSSSSLMSLAEAVWTSSSVCSL